MDATTLTPIEEKKKRKNKEAASDISNNNNWGGFGLSLMLNLIITFAVGLAGSNFIYLTRSASENMGKTSTVLEFLLPTKMGVYFPDKKVKDETNAYIKNLNSSIFTNCGKDNTCDNAESCTNYKRLAKFNIGTLGGWPYSMRDPKVPSPLNLWTQFKYWIADSIADSYIRNRDYLQKVLSVFAPEKQGGNVFASQPFQIFFVTPLVYLITPLIMLYILLSSVFSLFATSPGWAIFGTIFFFSTFLISYGISFVQMVQFIFTLTLVPLLADFKMVKNIFKCNGTSLVHFFLICTCISAFINLEDIIAGTIVGFYGVYMLYKLIKKYW